MFRRICTGIVALTVVVWLVVPASADVIYYDSFTRGTPEEPLLLSYSEPDARSGTLGGSATAHWFSFIPGEGLPWATLGENAQLGYLGSDTPIAASWLPFTPQSGYVYTYSMTMENTWAGSNNWLVMGFLNGPDDGGMAWFSSAVNPSGPGMALRPSLALPTEYSWSFMGPQNNGSDNMDWDVHGGPYEFSITLDTRGAKWTASFAVDGGATYSRGPVEYDVNPTITHIAFGNGGGKGPLDEFRLYGGTEPEPSPIPGDANLDWVVDDEDASILGANWLVQSGADWSMGDFNRDKKVNDADAAIMAAHWGQRAAEGASVPEPSTVALLLGALASLFVWRRRG